MFFPKEKQIPIDIYSHCTYLETKIIAAEKEFLYPTDNIYCVGYIICVETW